MINLLDIFKDSEAHLNHGYSKEESADWKAGFRRGMLVFSEKLIEAINAERNEAFYDRLMKENGHLLKDPEFLKKFGLTDKDILDYMGKPTNLNES